MIREELGKIAKELHMLSFGWYYLLSADEQRKFRYGCLSWIIIALFFVRVVTSL